MAEKKPTGVMLYFDLTEPINALSDENAGILFKAILNYADNGEVPMLQGELKGAWAFIKPVIDRDRKHYIDVCEKRSHKKEG